MSFWRLYIEFHILRLSKKVGRMGICLKRYFYITVPCKALTNIYIYATFGAPCNESMPKIMELVIRTELFKNLVNVKLFIGEHERAIGALRFLF